MSFNYQSASINEWSDQFWDLFGEQDKKRDLHKIWSEAWKDATEVGEAIREGELEKVRVPLAHTFCWIVSFIEKLLNDDTVHPRFKLREFQHKFEGVSDVIWYKYPRICSTCLWPACICPVQRREDKPSHDQIQGKLRRQRRSTDRPSTLDQWEDMFSVIYGPAHFTRYIEVLAFHFLEEMGEVEEAVRLLATAPADDGNLIKKYQLDLVEELADTISWTFSLARKLSEESDKCAKLRSHESGSLRLRDILWQEYEGNSGLVCTKCTKNPCDCPISGWILTKDDEA